MEKIEYFIDGKKEKYTQALNDDYIKFIKFDTFITNKIFYLNRIINFFIDTIFSDCST